jgi:hypothetical protein
VTRRDRIVLGVVVAAAALAAFWFLVLGPKRDDAKKLTDQVSAQQTRLSTAQSNLAQSQAARSAYKTNYSTVARLGKAVPADDDVPSLVYQLARTSEGAHVDFRSIKVSGGGSSGTPTPPTPSPSPGGKSGAATATPVATPTPSATQGASVGLPPGSSVGPAGFPTMPFSFQFDGSFFQLATFFNRLESYVVSGPTGVDVTGRLLQIDGISLNAAASGFPHMTASVAATAFLLPATQGATNGATPNAPAAGGPQPVSAKSTAPPTAPATATGPIK